MAKNNQLFQAITSTAGDVGQREAALSALLKVDPNDPDAFRLAVKTHEAFWGAVDSTLMAPKMNKGMGILAATPDPKYFTTPEFLDPNDAVNSFVQLRQLAVEQRVKLGLKDAEAEVLIDILKNNPDECRAYLASREEFKFLKEAEGWVPNDAIIPPEPAPGATAPVPEKPKNKSVNVFTDLAINNIKAAVSQQLLLKSISTFNKVQLKEFLNTLNTATLNTATLRTAATTLGLQPEVANSLTHSKDSVTIIKAAVSDRINTLNQEEAQANVNDYIDNLSEEDLLAFKPHLEADINTFKANLPRPYNTDLVGDALTHAHQEIALRFLQLYLPNVTDPVLLALNTSTADDLKTQLKAIPAVGPRAYIDSSINDENMNEVRSYLVDALIAQQRTLEPLLALNAADTLAKFKTELGKLGVTNVDWVADSHLSSMKQWARTRAFEVQLDASKFGEKAHPALINAFHKLTPSKQNEILKLKPEIRDVLFNAKEKHIVEHYLGHGAEGAAEIAEENQRLALFKGIHNAEVARVLANMTPVVSLDATKVNEINKAFATNAVPPAAPTAKAINVSVHAEYKALVDAIKAQSGPAGNADFDAKFYKAFGLNANGSDFEGSTAVRDAIGVQHNHNMELLDGYHSDARQVNKDIYTVFLNEKKQQPATIDSLAAIIGAARPARALTDDEKKLKLKVGNDLEPLVKLRNAEVAQSNLASNAEGTVELSYNNLNERLKTVEKSNTAVTKNLKAIETINDVKDVHLMNPAFQGKAKAQSAVMLKELKELAEQTDLIVDQLRRNKEELHNLKASIPPNVGVNKYKQPVKDLDVLINNELKYVEKSLAQYEKAQAKLYGDTNTVGVIEVIDNAAKGKNQFTYKAEGFKYKVYNDSETIPQSLPDDPAAPAPVPLAQAIVGDQGKAITFLLGEKIGPNQVGVHDFAQLDANKVVKYSGRFTERHSVSKEREPVGKFSIESFPKASSPRMTDAEKEELKQAKFNFSMGMAVQILANQDEMPSSKKPIRLQGKNEEMLKHLYSALITIGVDKSAIKVESSAFNPSEEHGFMGVGFNKQSLKATLFDDPKKRYDVQKAKDELRSLRDQKSDKSGKREAFSDALKQTKDSKINEELEKTEELRKSQGPARGPR